MKTQRGQTLIEILLAVTVSIIVLSAIVVGIVNSLNNTQYTKNQNLANSYAQEGISVVKAIRDSDWDTFSSYTPGDTYCIAQNSTELVELTSSNCWQQDPVGVIFSREVKFEYDSDSCIAVTPSQCPGPTCLKGNAVKVTVSWADSKCPVGAGIRCHKVELFTCLSNIDQKSID